MITPDLYYLYSYNKFQACRYGFEGTIIDPFTFQHRTIVDDILETINTITNNIHALQNDELILKLLNDVNNKKNDAVLLRQIEKQVGSLAKMVNKQCDLWASN